MICIAAMLLFGGIAQAADKSQQSSQQEEKQPDTSDHKETVSLTIDKGEEESVHKLEKACIIDKLNKAAENWEYKNFNWVEVFQFFKPYMSFSKFILATSKKSYAISELTEVIINKKDGNIKTEQDAQFFIYSALIALHAYYVKEGLQASDNFYLLKQVSSVLSGRILQHDMIYHPAETDIEYKKKILMTYQYHFMNNPDIQKLQLTNSLKTLVSMIEKCSGIKPINFTSTMNYVPRVEDVLGYYQEDEQPVVFCCFIDHLTKFKKTVPADNSLKIADEKQLETLIVKDFNHLWGIANSSEKHRHLAKIAIFLFRANPLEISHLLEKQDADSQLLQTNLDKKINWESLDLLIAQQIVEDHVHPILQMPDLTDTTIYLLDIKNFFSEFTKVDYIIKMKKIDKTHKVLKCLTSSSQTTEYIKKLKIFLEALALSEHCEHNEIAREIYTKLKATQN